MTITQKKRKKKNHKRGEKEENEFKIQRDSNIYVLFIMVCWFYFIYKYFDRMFVCTNGNYRGECEMKMETRMVMSKKGTKHEWNRIWGK